MTDNRYYKTLEIILTVFVTAILVMAAIAVVSIHARTFFLPVSLTPKGFDRYLNYYGDYQALFVGSIAALSGLLALLRLRAAIIANQEKVKFDRFSEWKAVLDLRAKEIEDVDPLMKREFVRLRFSLFSMLYDLNFKVKDSVTLNRILKATFTNHISVFEQHNKLYQKHGGLYKDQDHFYSLDSFRYLITGSMDTIYDGIEADITNFYSEQHLVRTIDPQGYLAGITTMAISRSKKSS